MTADILFPTGDDFRLEACADNTGEIITDDIDDGSGSAPDDEDFI